ncbi:excisionase family DNA-binding protein [Neoroseomonas oryzicola]|uniref:Excisionase family DNA-binding protein n=1 Tax=Neoroseomonas oryzicola TaxID=535904 RepID=A0A9X9WDG6_9PROT|nr:excisionase family DNA-binding protein [Neoroseomonas oryzicola]NKE18541.1 excisionase family DNA-binding protein [Neoroseomonas oryzicola]
MPADQDSSRGSGVKRARPPRRHEPPPQGARLAPIPNASARGGWGRTTTYDLIRKGEIRLVKVGRRSLIDMASVDAYIDRLLSVGK